MTGSGWSSRWVGRLGVIVAGALLVGACSIAPEASPGPATQGHPSSSADTGSTVPTQASSLVLTSLPPAALPAIPQPIVCPKPTPSAAKSGQASASWPSGQLRSQIQAAWEQELAELTNGVGNPDTDSDSEDWAAFKASLSSGDASAVRSSTDAVLGHLRAACAAVAPYFEKAGAEAWAAETRALLDGMAGAIGAISDATIAGSKAAADAGWSRYQNVMLDHFWQSIRGNAPEMTQYSWPDGRVATVSRYRYSEPAGKAFDGSPDTAWLAGDVPAPQWIEIDLGWETTITGIRLLTFQDVAGSTDHVVTFGAARGDEGQLTRFTGVTRDRQWLEFTPPAPVAGVRVVRVTTLSAPSMVGWREIELITAPGSSPAPCPASVTPLAGVSVLMGEPSTAGNLPALAVDGNEATGWNPGDFRGPGNVRGWLRLELPKRAQVSAIRVLLGPGPANATYEVTWWTVDGRSLAPVNLAPVPAAGGWVTAPGPTPCMEMGLVNIGVVSESPAAPIREVRVLGTLKS